MNHFKDMLNLTSATVKIGMSNQKLGTEQFLEWKIPATL